MKIYPQDLPEKVQKVIRVNSPVYDHEPYGWIARNHVDIDGCRPVYTNTGGGITKDELMSLRDAIKQSISNVQSRINEGQKLISELSAAENALK